MDDYDELITCLGLNRVILCTKETTLFVKKRKWGMST